MEVGEGDWVQKDLDTWIVDGWRWEMIGCSCFACFCDVLVLPLDTAGLSSLLSKRLSGRCLRLRLRLLRRVGWKERGG